MDVTCYGYHLKRDHCRVNQASRGIRWNSRRVKVYRVDKNLREEDQRKRCAPLYFVPPLPPSFLIDVKSLSRSARISAQSLLSTSSPRLSRVYLSERFTRRDACTLSTDENQSRVQHQINDAPISCIYN